MTISNFQSRLYRGISVALFTAVLIVSAQIALPIGVVPMTLQTLALVTISFFFPMLEGLSVWGLYLVMGAVGLPVFAGFKGGLGPTAGFIFGFAFIILAGAMAQKCQCNKYIAILMSFAGILLCHLCGVLFLGWFTGMGIEKAFYVGSLPYLIKDFISVVVGYFLAVALKKAVSKFYKFDF